MECRQASTEADRLAILRQRYDIFVEEFNYLAPREDGERIERDQYDDYSLLFGVWEKNDLLASCRLVLPNNPVGLPTSNALQIDSEKLRMDRHTAEISRITIAAKHRQFKKSIKILQSMRQEILHVSTGYGITRWIGSVESSFMQLLNLSHLPFTPIGPLQHHIGPDRYPVVLTVQDCITSLKEHP